MSWDAIAAIGTVGAVLVAAYQIWLARRESRLRTTFEHLREVEARLAAMGKVNPRKAQAEVIAAYKGETKGLSDGALAYLSLLNALEFMALAISAGSVDERLGKQQVKAICKEHVVDTGYLARFREASKDPEAYENLERVLRLAARSRFVELTMKAEALIRRRTDERV